MAHLGERPPVPPVTPANAAPTADPVIERARRGVELLTNALADTVGIRRQRLLASDRDVAAVALAVAERIVRARVEVDPAVVRAAIEEAVAKLPAKEIITLHVAPADVPIVESWLVSARPARAFTVAADPALSRGGSRLTCSVGEVDATVEGQLEAASTALGLEGDE